jgi:glycosyltransferase involved in cell wall biosynthesis
MKADADCNRKPILVYVVTEDWYFLSHRLPMACEALRAGYEVHVLTHFNGHEAAIAGCGFHVHPLPWRRGSVNPRDVIRVVRAVRKLYRDLAPDLAHQVALQPSVIGSLAATGLPIVCLNAITGLGFAFTSRSLRARIIRTVIRILHRPLFNRSNAAVLVQNPDDQAAAISLGIDPRQITMIRGSGVDTDVLTPLSEPDGPVTAAFVGRLLDDKGVRTLIAAHDLLVQRGKPVALLLAGETDRENPSAIGQDEIDAWRCRPGIEVLGQVADIRAVWSAAHIAVLPSRREGLPKCLLEAAACGRAIVATDVPGCREIAHAGHNALLVPPDDPIALADAIEQLASDSDMRRRFAAAGRTLVETEFSSSRIGREVVALYDHLLGARAAKWAPILHAKAL